MNITIANQFEIEVEFTTEFKVFGQWSLIADVSYRGNRTFLTQRVFADFIDELIQYKQDNSPSSNEIDKFCNDKSFRIEEDDEVQEWCQEVDDKIAREKTYDIVIENAHEYFGNLITSDEFVSLIEDEIKIKLSDITRAYLIEQLNLSQLDWDNSDEKESEIITKYLAELIADNIL